MIEHQHHNLDDEKKPAGGRVKGTGFDFEWNSGPPEKPNGAYVEDVLAAVIGRLQFVNKATPSRNIAIVLNNLETGLLWLQKHELDTRQPP